jgi:hypothetical protein
MRAKIAGIGLAGLALSFSVCAQQRGGMAGAPIARPGIVGSPVSVEHLAPVRGLAVARPAVHPAQPRLRTAVPRKVGHPAPGTAPLGSIGTASRFLTPNRGSFSFPGDSGYPVPGLGFDYPHYFATHPNANRHQGSFDGAVFPFVGGGIYLPIPVYEEASVNPAAEPVEEAANAENSEPATEPAGRDAELAPRVRVRAEPKPAPVSEYVFVKRDGTVFFAVAYSVTNAKLQYVTQDGLRRMVPIDTLDLDATEQFNEQRGLSFRAPA